MAGFVDVVVGFRRFAITQALTRRFGTVGGSFFSKLQAGSDPIDRWAQQRRQKAGVSEAVSKFRTDVRVRGMRDLRRALRRVDRAADKAIEDHLRTVAGSVAVKARARTPVRTGKLQKSIKPSVTVKRGAAVVSNLPYAKVHEWGGTIRPRGVPITIQRSAMITRAVESSHGEIDAAVRAIGDEIERAWR